MTRGRANRAIAIAGALLAGFIVVSLFDGAVYRAVGATTESRARLDSAWWYQVLRQSGSIVPWLVIGLGLLGWDRLHRGRGPWQAPALRGPYIAASAGAAGLGAELLKLLIGRERPATIQIVDGVEALVYQGYHFRGLFSGFADGSNLGLPSSHAATAAGGAFAAAMLCPRVWPWAWLWVWPLAVGIAGGCAVSRVLTGAHFASDAYGGIVLGLLAAWWLGGPWLRRHPRRGSPA
jgi:membrane-associated phospholipid phosphatase